MSAKRGMWIDRLRPLTCRHCGPRTGGARGDLILRERSVSELGRVYTTGPQAQLAELICADCGTLIDAQVTLAGSGVLTDVVEEA